VAAAAHMEPVRGMAWGYGRVDGTERPRLTALRRVLGSLAPARLARARWREGDKAIEPLIRDVVAERLGVDLEQLGPGVSLTDDLAADSLDLAEVTIACEERLGIT